MSEVIRLLGSLFACNSSRSLSVIPCTRLNVAHTTPLPQPVIRSPQLSCRNLSSYGARSFTNYDIKNRKLFEFLLFKRKLIGNITCIFYVIRWIQSLFLPFSSNSSIPLQIIPSPWMSVAGQTISPWQPLMQSSHWSCVTCQASGDLFLLWHLSCVIPLEYTLFKRKVMKINRNYV